MKLIALTVMEVWLGPDGHRRLVSAEYFDAGIPIAAMPIKHVTDPHGNVCRAEALVVIRPFGVWEMEEKRDGKVL